MFHQTSCSLRSSASSELTAWTAGADIGAPRPLSCRGLTEGSEGPGVSCVGW